MSFFCVFFSIDINLKGSIFWKLFCFKNSWHEKTSHTPTVFFKTFCLRIFVLTKIQKKNSHHFCLDGLAKVPVRNFKDLIFLKKILTFFVLIADINISDF